MERNRLSKEHSHARFDRREDKSGHGKKLTERGALTSWRRQRDEIVRTRKEFDRARGTHVLESAENGTCQGTKRNQLSKGYSLPRDDKGWDMSGHGQKLAEPGALTA